MVVQAARDKAALAKLLAQHPSAADDIIRLEMVLANDEVAWGVRQLAMANLKAAR